MKLSVLLESDAVDRKIDELSFRKSLGQPGKTFLMKKIAAVDETNNHLEPLKWENFRYYDYAVKKTIKVKDLVCIQDHVDSDHVKKLSKQSSFRPISVVQLGGKNYVVNGHHRLAAQILLGKQEVECKVEIVG